jgi:hypothetical protein
MQIAEFPTTGCLLRLSTAVFLLHETKGQYLGLKFHWTLLCLIFVPLPKHYNINRKGIAWSGGIAPHITNLSTWWRWVVSFTLQLLCPWGKRPVTHWTGRSVGPRVTLEGVAKRKNPCACRKSDFCYCINWAISTLMGLRDVPNCSGYKVRYPLYHESA